jgi:nitrile hydratase
MNRPHDVGGMPGFGPIERALDEAPFHSEWEGRVLALNRILIGRGVYSLDEFRAAVEAIDADRFRALSYYERWLEALEALLAQRGLTV